MHTRKQHTTDTIISIINSQKLCLRCAFKTICKILRVKEGNCGGRVG